MPNLCKKMVKINTNILQYVRVNSHYKRVLLSCFHLNEHAEECHHTFITTTNGTNLYSGTESVYLVCTTSHKEIPSDQTIEGLQYKTEYECNLRIY